MNNKPYIISIVGTVGVGKSTLAKMFENYYNVEVFYETFDQDILENFYKGNNGAELLNQLHFLNESIKRTVLGYNSDKDVIVLDRDIIEHIEIFAKGSLKDNDYVIYKDIAKNIQKLMKILEPDLIIDLSSSYDKIETNIRNRGRISEINTLDNSKYFEKLTETYNNFKFGKYYPKTKCMLYKVDSLSLNSVMISIKSYLEDIGIILDYDWNKSYLEDISAIKKFGITLEDISVSKQYGITLEESVKGVKLEFSTPNHYDNTISPLDYMRATFCEDKYRGFCEGNIIKYITRYEKKNGVEDLKKARNYLEELISFIEDKD